MTFTTIDYGYVDYSNNLPKDRRDIKKAFHITQEDIGTTIVAVAVAQQFERNKILEIPTTGSTPLNCDVYNIVRDVYHIDGVDFFEIGSIPVNYCISMDDAYWNQNIPLPYSVVRKYMDDLQCSSFDTWREKYKGADYKIIFIQTLGIY